MKKKVQDLDVTNKRVVLRCDFNVPIENGIILDDTKIIQSLKTINYLIDNKCKIVILSHLGKIKSESDKKKKSLEVVAKRLNELVKTNVTFSKTTRSAFLEIKFNDLNSGDILLLENTRFEDFPNKLESNCDIQLASYWASLGEIFVMDAFGSSHRKHASTAGIAKFLPSCIGFLVQEEMEMLNKNILHAARPFTIIMGGAKIEDKLELMTKLIDRCDYMLLQGGLANSCLKALGLEIGNSLATDDENTLENIKEMLIKNNTKIVLPFDVIVGHININDKVEVKNVNKLTNEDAIMDIGPKTINKYAQIINQSTTIFVNGTAGKYEDERYANGTKELLQILKESNKVVVVGGGDAVSATNRFGYKDSFTYLSTGGGATLDYIINERCIGLDEIMDEEEIL